MERGGRCVVWSVEPLVACGSVVSGEHSGSGVVERAVPVWRENIPIKIF